MGIHDTYGKAILRAAAGRAFHASGSALHTQYGTKGGASIDGVVDPGIAVEIESRVSKQVRGAILDLILHPFPKKLLVLIPAHMHSVDMCANQATAILHQLIPAAPFQVVTLVGTGLSPQDEVDVARVGKGLTALGWSAA